MDPPPDIVVEIDVTNESFGKFSIYAPLSVPEIWRYGHPNAHNPRVGDPAIGRVVEFYERAGDEYRTIPESRVFPRLTPAVVAGALEQSKIDGQSAALRAFRRSVDPSTLR